MTVFDFADFREFMKFRISQRLYHPSGRKKSNLTRVAGELGYSSRSLLSMVLTGKRIPSDALCESVMENWKLSKREREYFRLLVRLERRRRSGQDTSGIFAEIRRLAGHRAIYTFKELEFSMLREWHYLVIKEMVEAPDFHEDPVWISKALGRKITPSQAAKALERMLEMNILRRDPVTGRLRAVVLLTETTHDVPSADIRLHQKEMIQRALEALEERPVSERFFNTLTIRVDANRLSELKEFLVECVRRINTDFSSTDSSAVHQLNLQFFEHTQNKLNASKQERRHDPN